MDFRVYAKRHGYIPCGVLPLDGRFESRPEKPCQNFPCAQKLDPFVSARLDKLQ